MDTTSVKGGRRAGRLRSSIALAAARVVLGSEFVRAQNAMLEAQCMPIDQLQARTQAKLMRIVQHAARNVPFYREYFRSIGVSPTDLRRPEDLMRFPVLSKADYRFKSLEFYVADNLPSHRRLEWTTSGSTGEPFRFFLDREAMPLVFASHLYYDRLAGLAPFDRYVRIMAPPAPEQRLSGEEPVLVRMRYGVRSTVQRLYEQRTQRRLSTFDLDGRNVIDIFRRIDDFKPAFVLGYASSLAMLADRFVEHRFRLTRPLAGVITIAETLTPDRRRIIEHFFKAPITNRYGLREFKFWCGQNCECSPDGFHMNTELVVPEILRDDGSPASPGEHGQLVLTHLSNWVMPFIRYATGDRATFAAKQCACGRGFPLIERLDGRSLECFRTTGGRIVDPVTLGQYLFVTLDYADAIRHYQLVHAGPDRADLLVVPGTGWSDEVNAQLSRTLSEFLGAGVSLNVRVVSDIPLERSGKRPIIKVLFNQNKGSTSVAAGPADLLSHDVM